MNVWHFATCIMGVKDTYCLHANSCFFWVFFRSVSLKQHACVHDQLAAKYHNQQHRDVAKPADWFWVSLKDNWVHLKDKFLSLLYINNYSCIGNICFHKSSQHFLCLHRVDTFDSPDNQLNIMFTACGAVRELYRKVKQGSFIYLRRTMCIDDWTYCKCFHLILRQYY